VNVVHVPQSLAGTGHQKTVVSSFGSLLGEAREQLSRQQVHPTRARRLT
jgi:hypothetical protein